jgi:hypothetical protein
LSLAATGLEEFGTIAHEVLLRNCPFHPLAASNTEPACRINHRFLSGFLRGLGVEPAVTANLHPDEQARCVRLRSSTPAFDTQSDATHVTDRITAKTDSPRPNTQVPPARPRSPLVRKRPVRMNVDWLGGAWAARPAEEIGQL